MRWGFRYGSFWLLQWSLDWTFSIGIHIDPIRRKGDIGDYGPYMDLHLGFVVFSVGYHPARANGLVALQGQGGIMRPEVY